ncbi:MAG: ComF family protein [Anaerolineae bacterium]|nr:ComF family protein [Anaerolineae bacterium]
MANLLGTLNWDIDLVVPVPLSKGRLRERGYNQAAALARPLAWAWGLCYSDAALRKIRETSSQVSLSLDQRKANVVGAFSANPRIALNRNILVVDDVMTTGATLDACAAALKQAGAQYIYGLTLARTPDMPQA